MNNKDFEHLIQEKLKDHEAEVPSYVWESVEKRLPHKKVFSLPVFFRYAAACAVVVVCSVSAYLFLRQSDNIKIAQEQYKAVPLRQDKEIKEPNSIPEITAPLSDKSLAQAKPKAEKSISPKTLLSDNTNMAITQEKEPVSATENQEEVVSQTNSKATETVTKKGNRPENISEEEYNRKLKEFEQIGKEEPVQEKGSRPAKKKGFSLGLLTSNALPGSKNTNKQPLTKGASIMGDELSLFSTPEPLKFTHKVPISIGFTVEKHLKRNWGIESGIVYTLLRSDYKTQSLSQEGKQELHYIGIPLQAIYRYAHAGNFSFYVAAGPKIDFNINGRRTETARNGIASSNGTEDIRDKTPQWSLQLRAGAAYAFIPQLELYAEPSMAYYINNNSDIPDLWKDKPLNFVFQVGLRTNF